METAVIVVPETPDDCCNQMGHTSGPSPVGTILSLPTVHSASQPFVATAVTIAPSFIATVRPALAPVAHDAFKRPHDPPHLHPFSLLI